MHTDITYIVMDLNVTSLMHLSELDQLLLTNYTLYVVFKKILSDPLATHPLNGSSFTTKHKDNDSWNRSKLCSKKFWWMVAFALFSYTQ